MTDDEKLAILIGLGLLCLCFCFLSSILAMYENGSSTSANTASTNSPPATTSGSNTSGSTAAAAAGSAAGSAGAGTSSGAAAPAGTSTNTNTSSSTKSKTTNMNDDGSGNADYLDRHNLDCSGQPISQFKLVRNSAQNQYQFQYTCSGPNQTTTDNSTNLNDDSGGNTDYLDRHSVDCNGTPITEFAMVRGTIPNPNKSNPLASSTIPAFQYKYKCGNSKLSNITTKTTQLNDDGGGNAVYLDRHNIDCGTQVLTQFNLHRDSTGKLYQYSYKCGTPS